MAEKLSNGFCRTTCDIDYYDSSIIELELANQLNDFPPELVSADAKLMMNVVRVTLESHTEMMTACVNDAVTLPCEGAFTEGIDVNTGRSIRCPLVLRQLVSRVLE